MSPSSPTSAIAPQAARNRRHATHMLDLNGAQHAHGAALVQRTEHRVYGGEGGIRTRDPGYPRYRFSRPALSTAQPPLRKAMHATNATSEHSRLSDSIARLIAEVTIRDSLTKHLRSQILQGVPRVYNSCQGWTPCVARVTAAHNVPKPFYTPTEEIVHILLNQTEVMESHGKTRRQCCDVQNRSDTDETGPRSA